MTYEESLEIITNAIQTDKMTSEQDIALSMAQKAIEKQIRKKPVLQDDGISYRCPVCNRDVGYVDILASETQPYCDCGQAIDWSDVK